MEQSKDQICPQAEEIIAEIKKEFGPNDIIETSTPLAGPIRYYLIKSGIDQKITFRIWRTMISSYVDFQKRNFKKK